MNILIINGPNLNMLGIREPEVYGNATYSDLVKKIKTYASQNNISVEIFQSNHEGEIVDKIQAAYFTKVDGIIINPAAYTHTSIAILDALKAVNIPAIEVHLSDISQREDFRKNSFVAKITKKTIFGKSFDGYIEALEYFLTNYVK